MIDLEFGYATHFRLMGYKKILQGASGEDSLIKKKKVSTVPFLPLFMLVACKDLKCGTVAIILRLRGNKDESQQVGNSSAEEKPWALGVRGGR